MSITRRTFVKGSAALPVLPVMSGSGCGNQVVAAPIVDAEVGDNPADTVSYGKVAVPVPMYPDLAMVGGAVMLRLAPLPPGTRPFIVPERGVLLIHRDATDGSSEFVATRADCPHQGCPLGYNPDDDQIQCPCHGSRFRAVADAGDKAQCAGLVVHLPAAQNLTVYPAERLGEFVYVDLNKDLSCGAVTNLPPVDGGKVTVPVGQFPVLGTVGGSLIGKPDGLNDKLMIARIGATEFTVVSAICTHRQCDISFTEAELDAQHFHCYCHGSEFTYDGAVLQGPAKAPLKKYPATFDGTTIVVTVG